MVKSFLISSNLAKTDSAKQIWKRMSAGNRTRTLMICVRNGITEEMLDAP